MKPFPLFPIGRGLYDLADSPNLRTGTPPIDDGGGSGFGAGERSILDALRGASVALSALAEDFDSDPDQDPADIDLIRKLERMFNSTLGSIEGERPLTLVPDVASVPRLPSSGSAKTVRRDVSPGNPGIDERAGY